MIVSKKLIYEMCLSFYRFLHLYLIDLDAKQFMFKIVVEIEAVSVLYIFASWVLVENACFSAGQGLQCTPELPLLCTGTRENHVCDTSLITQHIQSI